jgi:hypothetical protein
MAYKAYHYYRAVGLLLAADQGVIVLSEADKTFICAVLDHAAAPGP